MEFLLVTAVAMFILTTSAFFLFSYTRSSENQNAFQQAAQAGYNIVDEAANVYVYGAGSFVTVTATMPQNLKRVYTVENDTLIFVFGTQHGEVEVPVFSTVPINGSFADGAVTDVNSPPVDVHSGRTSYKVTSMGKWILINQTG